MLSKVKKPNSRAREVVFSTKVDITTQSLIELCELTNTAAFALGAMSLAINDINPSIEIPLAPSLGKDG